MQQPNLNGKTYVQNKILLVNKLFSYKGARLLMCIDQMLQNCMVRN